MALPGLDASVITAFVSRSPPSPILPPSFFIIVVQAEQFCPTLANLFGRRVKDVTMIPKMFVTAAAVFKLNIRVLHAGYTPTCAYDMYMYGSRA